MTATVARRYRFCASHRLHSEALSQAENQRVYGKCNNPYGHGHDYVFDVSVTGEVNGVTGLIIRLADLDNLVGKHVLADFAYSNLNSDLAEFKYLVPTTENVALVIAERLKSSWAHYFPYSEARLSSILMHETARNSFQVLVPQASQTTRTPHAESNESVIVNA